MRDHGTRACYVHGPEKGSRPGGCRCEPCRAANREAMAARNRSTAPPYVNAKRARAHVTALMAQGFGLKAQAQAAGVSATALSKIVYGDPRRGQALTQRIRPATEKAILGLTVNDAPDSARTIEPRQYLEVIEKLHDRGWTYTQVARALGVSASNLKPSPTVGKVTAGRYRAAAALLEQAPPLIGADEKGHNAAAARRALGWDPEAERRDRLRRAAQAEEREERQRYRKAARADEDAPPTLDLTALAAQEWRQRAACRLVPDDQTWIFWAPEADTAAMDACRQVCSWCPVAADCLDFALTNGEKFGIWGGTSERERRRIRRRRSAA